MLFISKGRAPRALVEYKKKSNAYFDGCPKDEVRKALLKEQGYLCAYCMKRIEDDPLKTKIEHWKPQCILSEYERLDYNNLFICCTGHLQDIQSETCDSNKGDTIITVDPRDINHINQIRYESNTGRMLSDDPDINYDIDVVLNLNCVEHRLMDNRKAMLDEFINKMLEVNKTKGWTKNSLKKALEIYEGRNMQGKKIPYSGIVIWYIMKRIR